MIQFRRHLLRLILGSRLPVIDGLIRVPGLRSEATVHRDKFGIPYIKADNDDDAWFCLGFCQAQDRAFQLEVRLRTARGTLSAAFGPQTIPIDCLCRRIGFRIAAERQLSVLDEDARRVVESFVRGINAGLEFGGRRKAPEFTLLRLEPTPWEPADVLAFAKLIAFLLIGNWDVELTRLKVLIEDGPEGLRDLDPSYPESHPLSDSPGTPAGPALNRLTADIEEFLRFVKPSPKALDSSGPEVPQVEQASSGSNAWALAGSRTASGRPILASDPHLEAALPPHWYLASIRTPAWNVTGAALAGSPAILAGHNGFAAWGPTAGLADTVDLFVEEVGPDGHSVRRGNDYEPCEVRREVIEVKRRPPVIEDVLVTSHGPVIGPALDGGLGAIAMRAIWLEARPLRGFLDLPRTRSLEEFRRAFEGWPLVSQSIVYADEEGHIAYQLVGDVPLRRRGWGTLPLPGADIDAGWEDEGLEYAAMPHVVDPPAGYVVSANNKPASDKDGGAFLGVDWLDGYRAARIAEVIEQRRDWDLGATRALQMDVSSLTWREVREALLDIEVTTDEARLAQNLLRDWDGQITVASPAASIFGLFVAEMRRRMARARAPNSFEWALGKGFTPLLPVSTFTAGRSSRVLRALREQPDGWFAHGWPNEMRDALAVVVRNLRQRHGPDASSWTPGRLRPLTLRHPVGRIPALAPVFNRGPYAWGGDGNTVSPAGGVIASMRMVVEPGDWDGARFVLPGGQSGNPFSPHYDDLLPYWLRGEGVPIASSPLAILAAARSTLHLRPTT